ncbi:MAG: ABC transporter substrate-binding protein [Candidatus Planktophila sp.]|jgi:branched-chain amino acid transport system substrate-binding protein
MTRINRRKLISAGAVLAVVSLSVATVPAQALSTKQTFSSKYETGVNRSEIKLGMTLPMTGAASPGYNKIPGAMKAYFDYLNDNGGVNGRKITLKVEDDQYVPTLAVAKTNKLILRDKVMALIAPLGTANNKAVAASVNPGRRGVPVLFVNTGFSGFADAKKYPTTYTILPSYVMEAKIMAEYIKENFAGKTLGLVYQDDDFGTDALKGFAQAGITFAEKVAYASGSQSATTAAGWVSKLSAAKCDVVILFGVSSATAAGLGTAAALKYSPQWILGSVGGDATTIKAAGVPAGVLYNAVGASFAPSTTDMTDEYVKLFSEIYEKAVPGSIFDNNVLVGMNSAFVAAQALKAAGKNPTRKSLLRAIAANGANFASAALVPLNYSKTSHVGYNGYWFGKYSPTGDLKPIDGKYVLYTTDSESGAVVKSTWKRPAMPAKGLPE